MKQQEERTSNDNKKKDSGISKEFNSCSEIKEDKKRDKERFKNRDTDMEREQGW